MTNTNVIDRISSRIGLQEVEIYREADFPAPSAGVITLPSGNYLLKANVAMTSALQPEPGAQVGISARGVSGAALTYSGAGAFLRGNSGSLFTFNRMTIALTADGVSLLDTDGMLVVFDSCVIMFTGTGAGLGVSRNHVVTLSFLATLVQGFTDGLQVIGCPSFLVDQSNFQSAVVGGSPVLQIDSTTFRLTASSTVFGVDVGTELFEIDPSFTGLASIDQIFNANGSPFFASPGLDETDPHVDVQSSQPHPSSKTIGSVVVSGNVALTTVPGTGTWVDLNLAGLAVAGSNIERWTLTDTTTGELAHAALDPFAGKLTAALSIVSQSATQTFEFRAVKNGIPLSDGVVMSRSVAQALGSLALVVPIACGPGDLIRLQTRNVTGSFSLGVVSLSVDIS